jgi:threonine dehydratase
LRDGSKAAKPLRMFAPHLPRDPNASHRLRLSAIHDAAAIIDPVFLNSPQFDCEALSEALGCKLTLKLETANPIRSFKGRGASWLAHNLPSNDQPVVAASAGNWGQAMAYACRSLRKPIIIYASVNANPLKIKRMKALGADVRLHGDDFDASKIEAASFAKMQGLRMVADGLDIEASEGAATIAVELLARGAEFDAVVVPLGNGAMLTGIGRWFKATSPKTRVIGVCATGADAMEKSWRQRKILAADTINTIADGIGVRVPIPEAVSDMLDTVDDVLLVEDQSIISAMQLTFDKAGLVTEPSGAAGVAALLAHGHAFKGHRVATIICGSNITDEQSKAWLCRPGRT